MLKKNYVFNLVGKKHLVDKSANEIKNIIFNLTNKNAEIIMENKDSIIKKIYKTTNKYNTQIYINKYYFENDNNINQSAEKITNLSRHIRNESHDYYHPWVMHIENDNTPPISDFMNICKQVNCVYPLNSSIDDKKNKLSLYID